MPKQTAHIRKYSHNKEFSENEYLKDSANIDWAIIATFYSALHLIEGLVAKHNLHFSSHKMRAQYVSRDKRLRELGIPAKYNTLYNQSIRARYDCVAMDKKDLSDVVCALNYIEDKLLSEME
nr:MAG TPA: HEPN domain [Caudoviricetes sp.]